MSNQLNKLHTLGLSDDLKKYMNNNIVIQRIKNCINDSHLHDNVYKTVASFEDANIVDSSEVPVGSEKQKMNYLLTAAVNKLAPLVKDNIKLAGSAAKTWNENVGEIRLQEKLNATVAKLKMPIKEQAIPSYSTLSPDQRILVQEVFQTTLKREEPLSIDFIIEAIDRYNAGADRGVLFDKLGLVLNQDITLDTDGHVLSEHLLSDDMFTYLLTRWESYQKLVSVLGQETSMSPLELSIILDDARLSKSGTMDNLVKESIMGVDFNEQLDKYNNSVKSTTSFADLKPYLKDNNIINTLSTNATNRLRGLCTVILALEEAPFYEIKESESDLDSEDSYHALAVYFELIEELTQNLTVFLLVTQSTVRSSTVMQNIINVIDTVDGILTELFTKVNDVSTESGSVSQESFKLSINKLLGFPVKDETDNKPNATGVEHYNNISMLANKYIEVSDNLFRLKLRDSSSLNTEVIKTFSDKHGASIKRLFNIDISKMDVNNLFTFMTNAVFTTTLTTSTTKALSANLFNSKDDSSLAMRRFIDNNDVVIRMLYTPFTPHEYGFASCSVDAVKEFSKISMTASPSSDQTETVDIITTTVDHFAENIYGTYYRTAYDWQESFPVAKLEVLKSVKYTPPYSNRSTTLGYSLATAASQKKLHSCFMPNNSAKITLNTLKNNIDIFKLVKNNSEYVKLNNVCQNYLTDANLGLPELNRMNAFASGILPTVTASVSKNANIPNDDAKQYNIAITAMANDISTAIEDIKARAQLAELITTLSSQAGSELSDIYITFNNLAEDFITIAK